MKGLLLVIVFSLLLPGALCGQKVTAVSFQQMEEQLMNQLNVYPQEKIHVHTDRDYYVPGEKIWFKAYVADATIHHPSTSSHYVYAELIDSRDSLVNRVMIRPTDEGLFHGHIFLTDLLPEGDYTFRAYTRYMENLGEDYFFQKNIRIGKLLSAAETPSKAKPIKKEKTAKDDFDVSFFPEGGNLPEGVMCQVAFKALNKKGYPETIAGMVVDENGSEIVSTKTLHAGMGVFSYIPEQGKRYTLKCRNANGLEKSFKLPAVDAQAYSLTALRRNNRLQISIRKAIHQPDRPCYLLAHCRGLILYFAAWDLNKEVVSFAEEQLPAGVIQFVLFDEEMNPISERLVFNKHLDDTEVTLHTDKDVYGLRENIHTSLSVTNAEDAPLAGHLSVAVTDDKDLAVDASTTILSSLLLTSELKGYIENPAYYLQDTHYATTALDYLMMTHGWRRYNVPEVVKGNLAYPSIPHQASQEITGRVTSLMRSKPVTQSAISVLVNGDFASTVTDEKGEFSFQNFEYPDSTSYFIQALSKSGSSWISLDLDRETYPALAYAPQSPSSAKTMIEEKDKETADENAFIAKAAQRSQYDEDMRLIQLGEVVVTASKSQPKKEERRNEFWQNRVSDMTIRKEDIGSSPPVFVSDLILRLVPSARMSPNGEITLLPPVLKPLPPLVYIDGMMYTWPEGMVSRSESPLEYVSPSEIESIDITKFGGTALFGMHGSGGVISITTKRDIDAKEKFNQAVFTPLGYQQPVAFYAPRYETAAAKHLSNPDFRTTIYWKPDIHLSETGEASFNFYSSDFPTTYSVVLEGLTADGRIIREIRKIEVVATPQP